MHSHLEGEGRLEDDEHRAEVDESTRRGLKTQLVLDAIAEKEAVQVQQEELIEFLVQSSQQYGMDPNQFAQSLDQEGQIPAMVAEVARRKALATVLEQVSVKDTAGNVIDLNETIPGTEDDELEASPRSPRTSSTVDACRRHGHRGLGRGRHRRRRPTGRRREGRRRSGRRTASAPDARTSRCDGRLPVWGRRPSASVDR